MTKSTIPSASLRIHTSGAVDVMQYGEVVAVMRQTITAHDKECMVEMVLEEIKQGRPAEVRQIALDCVIMSFAAGTLVANHLKIRRVAFVCNLPEDQHAPNVNATDGKYFAEVIHAVKWADRSHHLLITLRPDVRLLR